jgi:hypothetical protein
LVALRNVAKKVFSTQPDQVVDVISGFFLEVFEDVFSESAIRSAGFITGLFKGKGFEGQVEG